MVDLTVAICTYNGEKRLPKVLERLLGQQETEHFTWEVIVIDNNSKDLTKNIIKKHQRDWPKLYPLSYYFEAKQGLAFARRLAVKKARGQLIAFLDDDNWPTENWVAAAYQFARHHPQAGAYGSQIRPEYATAPPKNFQQIACFLGIIDRGQEPFRYDLLNKWLFPAGAGMVIRQEAWRESVPNNFLLTGVSANSLSSKGEDIETLSYIRKKGWEIWHNPEMIIYHHLPQERLEKAYLLRLFQGVGLTRYPTRMVRLSKWQQPFYILLYLVSDFSKLIAYYLKNHRLLKTDLVTLCQFQLLINSLLSPFYYWTKKQKV